MKIYDFSEGNEDCFLIQIKKDDSNVINMVVDGGNKSNILIEALKENRIDKVDYIVLTHIDQDHLKGLIKALEEQPQKFKDTIIIYNKFTNGIISYKQAEVFEKLVEGKEIIVSYKGYQTNTGEIEFLSVEQRKMIKIEKDKVYLTFLSPNRDKVEELHKAYRYNKDNNKLKVGRNSEIVNRSSIMFLLEYNSKVLLMLGDGYVEDIKDKLVLLSDSSARCNALIHIDCTKVSHHGSPKNNEGIEYIKNNLKCNAFILTSKNELSKELYAIIGGNIVNASSIPYTI